MKYREFSWKIRRVSLLAQKSVTVGYGRFLTTLHKQQNS